MQKAEEFSGDTRLRGRSPFGAAKARISRVESGVPPDSWFANVSGETPETTGGTPVPPHKFVSP
jgi:hypothetical protein